MTALFLVMKMYAGARFLTCAVEIKVRWVFEVFFSEIGHTLGSVYQQIVLIRKGSASVHAGAV